MKAKELMCDDIVSRKGNLYNVSGIMREADGLQLHPIHLRNSEGLILGPISCFAQDIEPVILTPEILEKNGFKKVGTYEWQRGINVTRWRLYADDFDSMVEILHAPKYDGFTWKGCDVNYINKLQHALRLCGQTDLADNFKV